MKLPKHITIKGQTYRVAKEDSLKDEDGNELIGECSYEKKTISVEAGLGKALEAEVFVHECLHALIHECHFELDKVREEEIINAVCGFLFRHFRLKLVRID